MYWLIAVLGTGAVFGAIMAYVIAGQFMPGLP
jgi:hypothetical protein